MMGARLLVVAGIAGASLLARPEAQSLAAWLRRSHSARLVVLAGLVYCLGALPRRLRPLVVPGSVLAAGLTVEALGGRADAALVQQALAAALAALVLAPRRE